ncbi:MAG: hypothetical protein AVO39_02370 [delta proteobacterium MLS_D]|jgi:G3E family GTPase|nr:MAG: hypothetical protein AVO39_02370 [delta proteobacterium MLS_D]
MPSILGSLDHFITSEEEESPDIALRVLLRAILYRTQFQMATRRAVGWRGMKHQVSAAAEGWTARIAGNEGVFGLFFLDSEPVQEWITCRFGLCYFPNEQESLVERFSLQVAAVTQQDDYQDRIREFLKHSDLMPLFGIGTFFLFVRKDHSALAIAMLSESSQRTVAKDGVTFVKNGIPVQLLSPGEVDRDFPAFDTALGFFDVLTASITLNLDRAPDHAIEKRYTGFQQTYSSSGEISSEPAPDLWNGLVMTGYGEADFDRLSSTIAPEGSDCLFAVSASDSENAPPSCAGKLWWGSHRLGESGASAGTVITGIDQRPPLIILTGFLGSGKTSFLQHFIDYQTQRSRFVAVIQNELGEIGLDGKLLDYTVTEIDEGCVCCTLSGSLKRTVREILDEYSPDVIILETSGLANPFNLQDEIKEMDDIARFDCVLTVVDAENIEGSLREQSIAVEQIRGADIVMINKKDLVPSDRLASIEQTLRDINPTAPLIPAVDGILNPALLMGADLSPKLAGDTEKAVFLHPSHLRDGLSAKSIRLTTPVDREKFLRAVEKLPPSVFRVKGILDFSDLPEPALFQYVGGRHQISIFPQPPTDERFLTIIGDGPDTEKAASVFLSLTQFFTAIPGDPHFNNPT